MKPYVKPELYYENFELAQHIAGCSLTPVNNGTSPENCQYQGVIGDVDTTWFITGSEVCRDVAGAEGYCYTESTQNLATINS